jgi:hypothetical protein
MKKKIFMLGIISQFLILISTYYDNYFISGIMAIVGLIIYLITRATSLDYIIKPGDLIKVKWVSNIYIKEMRILIIFIPTVFVIKSYVDRFNERTLDTYSMYVLYGMLVVFFFGAVFEAFRRMRI